MSYSSKFFPQTHPYNLAALGTLFGMTLARIENYRVLEPGCGTGSNLLAHSFGLPDASFTGADLGVNHIAAAKAAAEINVKNVEFRRMDVTDPKRGVVFRSCRSRKF